MPFICEKVRNKQTGAIGYAVIAMVDGVVVDYGNTKGIHRCRELEWLDRTPEARAEKRAMVERAMEAFRQQIT